MQGVVGHAVHVSTDTLGIFFASLAYIGGVPECSDDLDLIFGILPNPVTTAPSIFDSMYMCNLGSVRYTCTWLSIHEHSGIDLVQAFTGPQECSWLQINTNEEPDFGVSALLRLVQALLPVSKSSRRPEIQQNEYLQRWAKSRCSEG